MMARIAVPEELMAQFHQLVAGRPNIAQLGMPLGIFTPRFDAYLSEICRQEGQDPNEIDLSRYLSAGLLGIARWMQKYRYWGRYGHTVNPQNFLLEFPAKETCILWIPKNSCTSIKTLLLAFEPEEKRSRILKNRFHETVQREFGIPVGRFSKDAFAPAFSLIRNPYERLVSCYIDKFATPVIRKKGHEGFARIHIMRAQAHCGAMERGLEKSISFAEFLHYIAQSAPWEFDQHWRPQSDFLCEFTGREGTRLVRSSNFKLAAGILGIEQKTEKHNVSVGKTFDLDQTMTGMLCDALPEDIDLAAMKSYNDFFTDDLLEIARRIYGHDQQLYDDAT